MGEPLGYFVYNKMWDALEAGLRAGRDPSDPKEFYDYPGWGNWPPLYWAAAKGCPPALLELMLSKDANAAFVDKYGYREELQEIAPVYRDNQMTYKGTIYGFPDDGDVFLFYYRKDLFEDAENKAAFKAKHGYDLAPPATWKQFSEIGQFLTDKYAPELYGAAFFRNPPYTQWLFQERFRVEGGKFFDPETMRATVNNDIGVRVFARGANLVLAFEFCHG